MVADNARIDVLTGLIDRKTFEDNFEAAIQQARADGAAVSVALFDIDTFFKLNEEFGHGGGDAILRTVAKTIAGVLGERATASRYGGDEFAILFTNTEREQAFLQMERARAEVERLAAFQDGEVSVATRVTISGGVAAYPIDGADTGELIRKADGALYRAKATGRNKIVLGYEERMVPKTAHFTQTQLERLTALAKEQGVGEAVLLREALDNLLIKYEHGFIIQEKH